MYLSAVSLEETFAYSGYNVLPSGFILAGMARRQERHFSLDFGNYSCWGLCDFVMGTSLGSDVLEDVRDEAQADDRGEKKGKAKAVRKKGRK